MNFAAKISVALLAATASAYAANDMFTNLYSNTLVYTFPDKTVSKVLASKDGTWTSTSTDTKHPTNSGQWANVGGWLCSTAESTPKSKPWCRKAKAHAIGDKWTEARPDGSVVQVTLVAGR